MNDGRSWSLIWSMALLGSTCKIINADRNLISYFSSTSHLYVSALLLLWICHWRRIATMTAAAATAATPIQTHTNNAAFLCISFRISVCHSKWIFYIRINKLIWVIQRTHTQTRTQWNTKNGIAHFNPKEKKSSKQCTEKSLRFSRCVCVFGPRLLFAYFAMHAQSHNSIFTFLWNNLT